MSHASCHQAASTSWWVIACFNHQFVDPPDKIGLFKESHIQTRLLFPAVHLAFYSAGTGAILVLIGKKIRNEQLHIRKSGLHIMVLHTFLLSCILYIWEFCVRFFFSFHESSFCFWGFLFKLQHETNGFFS